MVEFGLKLEDNKVKKWSNQYLDYEGLKKLLKKCKTVLKARDSLVKKYPNLALGPVCSRQTSPLISKEVKVKTPVANERTALLTPLKKAQCLNTSSSNTSLVSLNSSTVSGTSTARIKRTLSEALFSNLFKGDDAANISKKYSEMGSEYVCLHREFVDALTAELEKVNSFYLLELQDINDSVTDAARAVSSSIHSAGEENFSYGNGSAESNALASSIMNRTGGVPRKRQHSSRRMKVARVLGLVDAASESENEGDDDEDVDYKKADSIKRNVVD
eukprot:CAMPEP_0116015636 /NCGR_PEP_ID=MMETSP0321-20121206/6966_1 /TAXON_ID=163516 /ORGANISM="Leptocylindrus danicus var. danicus, Strain B650" /LENGTH=273 /DNA_ID=CAMNT_0003485467 /DNA_START=156 /DNA_END=975 /DNA_ORIENTATION=+